MKKPNLLVSILFAAMLIYGNLSYAQIEMNASGNVAIGGGTPSTTYDLSTSKLLASGDAMFS